MGANPSQSRQLAEAATAARSGAPLPWSDDSHRARCKVCRLRDLAELEQRFLSWQPVAALAAEYGVTVQALEAHAACYLWHLRRCAELGQAYSRIIEAGVTAAQAGQAKPEHALRALRELSAGQDRARRHGAAAAREARMDDAAELAGGGGGLVLTYEERVRRIRAALAGDPGELRAVVGELGQPVERLDDGQGGDPAPDPARGARPKRAETTTERTESDANSPAGELRQADDDDRPGAGDDDDRHEDRRGAALADGASGGGGGGGARGVGGGGGVERFLDFFPSQGPGRPLSQEVGSPTGGKESQVPHEGEARDV